MLNINYGDKIRRKEVIDRMGNERASRQKGQANYTPTVSQVTDEVGGGSN